MPRYELMYILASSVSDDLVEDTSKQIEGYVTDFGGTNLEHAMLGKKKLAYPIRKTRNGHYGVINFDLDGAKVNDLDAKIRTQKNTYIRHIIVNIDEHLMKLDKDREAQTKMNRNRPPEMVAADNAEPEAVKPAPRKPAAKPEAKVEAKPAKKVTTESLDEEIEKALNEEVI